MDTYRPQPARGVARGAWIVAGLVLAGIGSIGAVVPVLPTTVFFIGAAGCFARSSPRLERWVLNLPHVGPMVRDYRRGLGMPLRAKYTASAMIAVAVTLSALAIASWPGRGAAVGLGLIGIGYVTLRVPTRERVLEARGRGSDVVPVTVLGGPDLPGRSRSGLPGAPTASHRQADDEQAGQHQQHQHGPR